MTIEKNELPPRLRLVSYFEDLVNDLDIKCETLLAINQSPKDERARANINKTRDRFLACIDAVKSECLDWFNRVSVNVVAVDASAIDEHALFKKYCFVLERKAIELSEVAVESPLLLGFLIVTDEYVSSDELSILKTVLRISFGNDDLIESVFNFEQDDSIDDEGSDQYMLSKSDLTIDNPLATRILMKNESIIRLDKAELFTISSMVLSNFLIKSVKEKFASLLLNKIVNLNLSANRIEKLSQIFIVSTRDESKSFNQLVELDLSQNCLNSSDSLTQLKFLTNLKFLSLSGNKLSRLSCESFGALVNLEYLLLDKNCIDLVDSGPFPAHLSKLKMLSLSKNIINNLPEDMFDNLVSLSHLDLSYNQLSSVRRGNFSRLKCLKVLSLKSNAIEFIEPGSFDELGQLVTLNLKRNQLKSGLAIDLLKGLVSLQALKIEEGVLAVEVREYIKSKNISTIF